jgi:hypothetical protein
VKNKTLKYLRQLIGLELSRQTRAANMQCFHFGKLVFLNEKKSLSEFSIHLQCPWRITNQSKIIVGDKDLYEPINEDSEYDENFDWDIIGGNLRDVKLEQFLEPKKIVVCNITTDDFGGFEIEFTDNSRLTVFPTLTRNYQYGEFWRVLGRKFIGEKVSKETKHFVVGTFGIEY